LRRFWNVLYYYYLKRIQIKPLKIVDQKQNKAHSAEVGRMKAFKKGDKVKDIYTGEIYTVKESYIQDYAGKPDYTVIFEPTATQPTPWNKSSNLELVKA
jgi:hypothetical protein